MKECKYCGTKTDGELVYYDFSSMQQYSIPLCLQHGEKVKKILDCLFSA